MTFTVANLWLLNINPNTVVKALYILVKALKLSKKIITLHFNKTNIKPAVLDGGNEIILAHWPNNKHIECNVNNDIPVKIPRFPYVLLNLIVLCNCEIEACNYFLLESLAACQDTKSK